jgi:hypothetical protein
MAQSRVLAPAASSLQAFTVDRVRVALCVVFVLAASFYVWTAATTLPLALTGGHADAYNQLANAFLHLRLSVGRAPARLLALSEPYNPAKNIGLQRLGSVLQIGIHDFVLYRGKLFIAWGPAPVVVLLVPLHLLGFEPTASVTVSIFAIGGLGFALATLRVVLRQMGELPLWMCVLSAFTLALASAVPFILRRPAVYEEEICAGYCFAMAGIWLAISTLAVRRASLPRLALMSLCIGLAIGSRPTLAFTGVLLVLVYISLRTLRPRRGLLLALIIPVGVCVLLLLAYNQVRFGSPLENGVRYQLGGLDQRTAHFDSLSYVAPGFWFYWLSPPRGTIMFPYLLLTPPPISYPAALPGVYPKAIEQTGGLLPMAPIVVFLAALPWLWRRRATSLGRLALPLLALAGAGLAGVLFVTYVFFSTTERYEVDFTTLFLLGALAAWLALSKQAPSWRRRLVRVGGALLATWSCVAGFAISFTGYNNLLATEHPGTWRTLQDISSPIARAVAIVEGHPVLAEVSIPSLPLLGVGERADLVIVSPDSRTVALHADLVPATQLGTAVATATYAAPLMVHGPGDTHSIYRVRPGGETVSIPVRLSPGLNRLALIPLPASSGPGKARVPASRQLFFLRGRFSLASKR